MQSILGAFRRPSDSEFAELWKKSTFFVDTNVLLNLYRYPNSAREDLLRAFGKLGKRLALPFHVALEYERNRPAVIADQKKRFREVHNVVTGKREELRRELEDLQLRKRHASIQADEYLNRIDEITDEFLRKLETLETNQPDVSDPDELRDAIVSLFNGRVGDPPSQDDLDKIYKEGTGRYQRRTPPGYLDQAKGGPDDEFDFGGLTYRRQFGDLVVWSQILATAAKNKLKHVIFVTDDEKEDWWWIAESQGKKRLGPRPELVEEIRRVAAIESFYMYNSEQFVRWSSQYLDVTVQSESAEQIREAKDVVVRRFPPAPLDERERAVLRWVKTRYPSANYPRPFSRFPDIVAETHDGQRLGFEVLHLGKRPYPNYLNRVRDLILRAYYEMDQRTYHEFWIVVVEIDPSETHRILQTLLEREGARLVARIGLVVGEIVGSDEDDLEFVPISVVPPKSTQA